MNIIESSIPLSPDTINNICHNNANNIKTVIDLETRSTPLNPNHILGYLSNLKIPFDVNDLSYELFLEYLTSDFFVGMSNLAKHHVNLLLWRTQSKLHYDDADTDLYDKIPEDIITQHMNFIYSLPMFLFSSSSVVSDLQVIHSTDLPLVGVNIAHLIHIEPTILLQLIGDKLYNFDTMYYDKMFDEYIYDGDKLIQFFVNTPDNLLSIAILDYLKR